MPKHASYPKSTAHGAALMAAILCGFSACKGSHTPDPLPEVVNAAESGSHKVVKEVSYRSKSGSPTALPVIADDPAPKQVQPVQVQAVNDKPAGTRQTLNGDPNGLTRDVLNQSIQSAMGSLAACFASMTQDPTVSVSFEADPSGKPSLVRVGGAPPDADHCVRNVVQNIRFPSFDGKGVQVDLPLSFHRVPRPAQPGSPSTEQQPPPGAPLFLEP
ncbi:MAG TPA: hypothetical protein VF524_06520 [Polyangia bacterium]